MELLVAILLISLLGTLAVTGISRAMVRGKQAACSVNLKNLGIAIRLHADEHQGRFPGMTHGGEIEDSWVYTLESYLGNFDEARICPADPNGRQRLESRGTSYILNSYLAAPATDAFGTAIGPDLTRITSIHAPERTPIAFICSDRTGFGPGNDHTHSDQWNSWPAVIRDISPGRFGAGAGDSVSGSTNILHVDGSVHSHPAAALKARIERGENFAKPPGKPGL